MRSFNIVGFCLCFIFLMDKFVATQAQMQTPIAALEGKEVQLTIIIPNNKLVNEAGFISIRISKDRTQNETSVLFLQKSDPKVTDAFRTRLVASYTGRTLTMRLANVGEADAGTFKCYPGASEVPIADCGQLLIIIRKPGIPTVNVLPSSSIVVGSRLQLLCETQSNSLPQNHGLASETWWYDQNGQDVRQSGTNNRTQVNAAGYLVIGNLERTDKGAKFSCASADNAGDVTKRIMSDKSVPYEVIPEYAPSHSDLVISPPIKDNDVLRKKIGESLKLTCGAECVPQCNLMWTYRKLVGPGVFSDTPVVAGSEINLVIDQTNEGSYQCKAENVHGPAVLGFVLEALYMSAPVVIINREERSSTTVPEKQQTNLTCVFDSNPGPNVKWISPNQTTLSVQKATLLPESTISGGVYKRPYSSSYLSSQLSCEDSGLFKCEGSNDVQTVEGQINLVITCPPSSPNIPGLQLMDNYAWETTKSLTFQFVIRAFPEPSITEMVSSLNGIAREEVIPRDIRILKTNYNNRPFLTKFELTSVRKLNQDDTDRVYTMTVQSGDVKQDFAFSIHPRGPPHQVINLTAENVHHDSLDLFWLPGFNGGEVQTFSVHYQIREQSETKLEGAWTSAEENIKDPPSGNWVEVKVRPLRSSTHYVIRVSAINSLGVTTDQIEVQTAAAPGEALSAGAVAGIVIAVLIVVAVLVVVLLYFFVYRKRYGTSEYGSKDSSEVRKPMIPPSIAAFFTRDKSGQRNHGNTRSNGSVSKKLPFMKLRNLLPGGSSSNISAPAKDYQVDGDEIGVYQNIETNENQGPLSGSESGTKTPESNRKLNDQGLVYVEVAFPPEKDKNKKKGQAKSKKNKKDENKNESKVDYSDIDFAQTAVLRKELEESRSRTNNGEEEDASNYDDITQTDSTDEKQKNKYADAGFGIGTTV